MSFEGTCTDIYIYIYNIYIYIIHINSDILNSVSF